MNLNDTPSANRIHIIVLGACNSGKSSLVNYISSQEVSLVSDKKGTTTDPVRKAMELPGIGPVVFIDTAGFDDSGELGNARVAKTVTELESADLAIILTGENVGIEDNWKIKLKEYGIPYVEVVNKIDIGKTVPDGCIGISSIRKSGKEELIEALSRALPQDSGEPDLLRGLVKKGDNVVLVMPQDSQAPKGRLILPQAQTIRALLDKRCNPLCTTPEGLPFLLKSLVRMPDLIITDSQVFGLIKDQIPAECPLTSFSVLMAAFKGDIDYFAKSAKILEKLEEGDRILIAEACSHAPENEDIGRVKIPALIRKKFGRDISFDIVSGKDFPSDLSPYKLVIHCGGCMFNRRLILSRINRAKAQNVAMTNYGITIAALTGLLNRIVY